jgi:hypothetical protein
MRALRAGLIVGIASCAAFAPGRLPAEVSAMPRNDGRVDTLIMTDTGITDGIDPIPGVWHVWRPLPADWALNPSGDVRNDGRPAVAYHVPSGAPVVVWAYNHGASHDVALSWWQEGGWSTTELVTSTPEDEVDPRVFVRADGVLFVVWWIDGTDPRVELTNRTLDGDSWTPPVRVSPLGEAARRPSVALANGAIWVAYERDALQNVFDPSEVVVRRRLATGAFDPVAVAQTAYDGPVEPLLHVANGRFWMDWRYSTDRFAYAPIADLDHEGIGLEPSTDPSWVGIEAVRQRIESLVGAMPPAAETEPDGP